jgi:DNA-binding CsgD family transcriptional regulator
MPRKISSRTIEITNLALQGYNAVGIAKRLGGRTGSINMTLNRLYDRMKIPRANGEFTRQALFILKTAKQNALDKLKNELCPYPDIPCSVRGKKHEPTKK